MAKSEPVPATLYTTSGSLLTGKAVKWGSSSRLTGYDNDRPGVGQYDLSAGLRVSPVRKYHTRMEPYTPRTGGKSPAFGRSLGSPTTPVNSGFGLTSRTDSFNSDNNPYNIETPLANQSFPAIPSPRGVVGYTEDEFGILTAVPMPDPGPAANEIADLRIPMTATSSMPFARSPRFASDETPVPGVGSYQTTVQPDLGTRDGYSVPRGKAGFETMLPKSPSAPHVGPGTYYNSFLHSAIDPKLLLPRTAEAQNRAPYNSSSKRDPLDMEQISRINKGQPGPAAYDVAVDHRAGADLVVVSHSAQAKQRLYQKIGQKRVDSAAKRSAEQFSLTFGRTSTALGRASSPSTRGAASTWSSSRAGMAATASSSSPRFDVAPGISPRGPQTPVPTKIVTVDIPVPGFGSTSKRPGLVSRDAAESPGPGDYDTVPFPPAPPSQQHQLYQRTQLLSSPDGYMQHQQDIYARPGSRQGSGMGTMGGAAGVYTNVWDASMMSSVGGVSGGGYSGSMIIRAGAPPQLPYIPQLSSPQPGTSGNGQYSASDHNSGDHHGTGAVADVDPNSAYGQSSAGRQATKLVASGRRGSIWDAGLNAADDAPFITGTVHTGDRDRVGDIGSGAVIAGGAHTMKKEAVARAQSNKGFTTAQRFAPTEQERTWRENPPVGAYHQNVFSPQGPPKRHTGSPPMDSSPPRTAAGSGLISASAAEELRHPTPSAEWHTGSDIRLPVVKPTPNVAAINGTFMAVSAPRSDFVSRDQAESPGPAAYSVK